MIDYNLWEAFISMDTTTFNALAEPIAGTLDQLDEYLATV